MPSPAVGHYLAWPWRPQAHQTTDGGWELTVPGLDDLAVRGHTEDEVWRHYPEALRSHLETYLSSAEPIPFPCVRSGVRSSDGARIGLSPL